MKKTTFACLAALFIFVFALAHSAMAEETTILTGKVRAPVTRNPPVNFNGVVEEVLVAPGDRVVMDQPILRYSLQDDARRALQREVNTGANMEGPLAQIHDLERQLTNAEAQRNKARSLAASGLGSNQALGRLQGDVASIEARIELLKATVEKNTENFSMRLEELSYYFDTDIKEGMKLPKYLYLKSPIEGYVIQISQDLNPGGTFHAGATPISIAQMDPMLIQVPVYEAEVSALSVGDEAKVEIPSLGRNYTATISEISWVSNAMDVSQASYFNVELTIPNPDLELKPGFKAVVRFTLK